MKSYEYAGRLSVYLHGRGPRENEILEDRLVFHLQFILVKLCSPGLYLVRIGCILL
jgi:hypothetical protein